MGRSQPLQDVVGSPIRVLFVGINPGVRSAAIGHHFAGYSNRFWPLLYDSGLVPERLHAEDDVKLVEWGYGVTNLVARCTPGIDSLKPAEYVAGRLVLQRKIRRWRPQIVALVGVTLFRALFPTVRGNASGQARGAKRGAAAARRKTKVARRGAVSLGLQRELLAGARVFVLPNPSGRNANFTYDEMRRAYRALARLLKRS